MTTIILTVIGILLAAAAALMIIFYGGDAFNKGGVGARANTLQNAGTNVLTAAQMFKADQPGTAVTLAALKTGTAQNGNVPYLASDPALSGIGTGTINAAGTYYEVALTETTGDVCHKVNVNLGLTDASGSGSAVTEGSAKMGCVEANEQFFVTL